MKKLCMLLLLLLCLFPLAALADSGLTFVKDQELVVFDQDGVKLTLTGEVKDSGMMFMQLYAVIENKTNQPISVSYKGVCNGWVVNRSVIGGGNSVPANAKAKTYLFLNYEELDIARFSDLTDATLDFIIENDNNGNTMFTVEGVGISFGGNAEPELSYFEECPILPDPTAYGAMYCSSMSGAIKVNGVPSSSAKYTYRSSRSDDLREAYDDYITALRAMSFTVSGSGTGHTIYSGETKLATTRFDDVIIVEVLPGNDKLGKPASAAVQPTSSVPGKKLGDTLTTSVMRMTLISSGVTDIIYSYDGREPDWYFYLEPQSGNRLLFIKASFTNLGRREVDIDNIYTQITLDGQYEYEGNVTGLRPDGKNFQDAVASQSTLNCYIYFEIPSHVVNNYKTCTVKLGFTDSFNTKISNALTGYNFDICDDVFEIDLDKGTSAGKANAASRATATPRPTTTPRARVTATPAPAVQDKSGDPILFQEIPWGSNPATARSALQKAGYISYTGAVGSFHEVMGSMLSTGDPKSPYELADGYAQVLYEDWIYETDIKKKIGGYEVSTMSLCYVYGVKNGRLNKDVKELISVNVELNAPDSSAALADLKTKLTKLYGEPVSSGFMGTVWVGGDDTCLVLYDFASPTLLYAKADNLSLVQQMYEELGFTASEDDMDGL